MRETRTQTAASEHRDHVAEIIDNLRACLDFGQEHRARVARLVDATRRIQRLYGVGGLTARAMYETAIVQRAQRPGRPRVSEVIAVLDSFRWSGAPETEILVVKELMGRWDLSLAVSLELYECAWVLRSSPGVSALW
jgi:hypothetical protein